MIPDQPPPQDTVDAFVAAAHGDCWSFATPGRTRQGPEPKLRALVRRSSAAGNRRRAAGAADAATASGSRGA